MLDAKLTNITKLAVTSSHLMTALLLSTYFPLVCYFSHCSLYYLLCLYFVCHGEDNSALMLRCSLTDIQLTTAWRSTTVHSSTTTPLYRIQSLSEPHCMGKHIHKSYIECRIKVRVLHEAFQYNDIK